MYGRCDSLLPVPRRNASRFLLLLLNLDMLLNLLLDLDLRLNLGQSQSRGEKPRLVENTSPCLYSKPGWFAPQTTAW